MKRVPVVAPQLDLGERQVNVSLWLVRRGAQVAAGDRLVELVTESLAYDVAAPCSGRLERIAVVEDEPAPAGVVLAWIAIDEDRLA